MKLLFLLLQVTLAGRSYLFQWNTFTNTTSQCDTPPSVVYSYHVSDPLKTTRRSNETWPIFAQFWAPFYPNKTCGNFKGKMDDYCCFSNLYPHLLINISAATEKYVDIPYVNSTDIFPKASNGATYCKLTGLASIFAFPELYIRADGNCQEQVFRCHPNNTIAIHPGGNCGGPPNRYNLNHNAAVQFFHPYVGVPFGRMVNVTGAMGKIGYTQFSPATLLTLSNQEPAEVLATIIYAVLLTMETCLLVYFTYRYFKLRKFSGLLLVIAHFFWLLFICIIMAYNYTAFGNRQDLNNTLTSWGFFYGLANLATAMYTANFIIIFWNYSKIGGFLMYAAVAVVHFGLMGAYYLFASLYLVSGVVSDYDRALEVWSNQVYQAWTLCLFLWDIIPICVILARASPNAEANFFSKIISSLKTDIPSGIMFFLQFPIAIGYLINEIVRTGTNLLGNDRNYQAARSYAILFVILHCLLNTIIIYRVAKKVQTSQISSSSKGGASSGKQTSTQASTTGKSTKGTETEN